MYCPLCSKKKDLSTAGKYECTDCGTKFSVDDSGNATIISTGKLNWLYQAFLLVIYPLVFPCILLIPEKGIVSSSIDSNRLALDSDSLALWGVIGIFHVGFISIREIFRKVVNAEDTMLIELYFAFFSGTLKKYGRVNQLIFLSSGIVVIEGLIFLLISFVV